MNPDLTRGSGRLALVAVSGAVTWLPLLVLAALGSASALGAFLGDYGIHVRFLFAVPAFVAIDAIRYRFTRAVVGFLDRSSMVVNEDRGRFTAAVAALERLERGKCIHVALAILAIVGSILAAHAAIASGARVWFSDGSGTVAGMSAAGWWYAAVGNPVWLYLLLRWLVAVVAWWRFLWVVSRLSLELIPSHPDRVGGLGVLAIAQVAIVFVAPAVSALLCAEAAEMMRSAAHAPVDLVAAVVVYTLFWVGVTVAPLLHFTPLLLRAKRRGLVAYGQLGDALFRAFDEKWTTPDTSGQQRLLGNPDPSSLADYGYAYEVVAGMRAVPIGRNDVVLVLVLTLVPFLPLVLLKYSVGEILQRLLGALG